MKSRASLPSVLLLTWLLVAAAGSVPQAPLSELLVTGIPSGTPDTEGNFQFDAVSRFDATTGAFLGHFVPKGDQGLSRPYGLTGGPDGNLYIVSSHGFNAGPGNGAVLRYDGATRAFIDVFAGPHPDLNLAIDAEFGPDENLYVTNHNGSVLRFDGATGAFVDVFVPLTASLAAANTLTFGPDGNLYVTALASNSIVRFDGSTGAFIDTFVAGGSGGLDGPSGMVFRDDGLLYVACGRCRPGAVLRYDAVTGAFVDAFVQEADVSKSLQAPFELAFGPDGHLYVSNGFGGFIPGAPNAVNRYDGLTGTFIDNFVVNDSGKLVQATGMIFWPPIPSNQPPTADAGQDQTIECAGPAGASVTLNGAASMDPDGTPLTFTWNGPFGQVGGTPADATVTVSLPLGAHTVTLTVMDDFGEMDSDEVMITVVDTTAPTIEAAGASPGSLWPPNHKMVGVSVSVDASDACSGSAACRITGVSSNEPVNGKGDGNTAPDWEITGDLTVDLRAERSGKGSGRVYTIDLACTDAAGNTSISAVQVTVPKSRGNR